MRETEEGADVVAGFAGGLLAPARQRGDGSEVAGAVLTLMADAVGATSAALHAVDGTGMLRRVAVRGLHPRQSRGTRASAMAEDMGPETIGTGEGVVGAATLVAASKRPDTRRGVAQARALRTWFRLRRVGLTCRAQGRLP